MEPKELGPAWQELSEEAISGIIEWRLHHPKATFAEIETGLDLRLARLRARMLRDTALASAGWSGKQPGEKPACPRCSQELVSGGSRRRRLQTLGRQEVELEREYGVCTACGEKFSPLVPPWMKSWNCCLAA